MFGSAECTLHSALCTTYALHFFIFPYCNICLIVI